MANRIKLLCLGATLAPYSSSNIKPPQLPSGGVSEYLSFETSQLQRNWDTTAPSRATFPAALSAIVIKFVEANHFQTAVYFINETQDQVNTAANS